MILDGSLGAIRSGFGLLACSWPVCDSNPTLETRWPRRSLDMSASRSIGSGGCEGIGITFVLEDIGGWCRFSGIENASDVDWRRVSTSATGMWLEAHALWTASYVAATCTCIIRLASSVVRGATSVASPRWDSSAPRGIGHSASL